MSNVIAVNPFQGCAVIAAVLIENQKRIETLQEELATKRDELRKLVEENLFELITEEERNFLNLRACSQDRSGSCEKTVLDTIIDNCIPEHTEQAFPVGFKFIVGDLHMEIERRELNQNGFDYDDGEDDVEEVANSLFGKLSIPVVSIDFNYCDRYVMAIRTRRTEFN